MRGSALGHQVYPKRTLLSNRQPVLGRLAVDQEAPSGTQLSGRTGPIGAILFTYQKQQSDPPLTLARQPLGGRDHCCRQPLRVAASPSTYDVGVLGQRYVRRNRVEVGREHHGGRQPVRVEILPA